jgi:hypothetical protein
MIELNPPFLTQRQSRTGGFRFRPRLQRFGDRKRREAAPRTAKSEHAGMTRKCLNTIAFYHAAPPAAKRQFQRRTKTRHPHGEVPDFIRHHGETGGGLAGTGSLHGGIQREEVRLERDLVID